MFFKKQKNAEFDEDGLGLGLTISRLIVNHYGGEIKVHSNGPKKGSSFMFSMKFDMDHQGFRINSNLHGSIGQSNEISITRSKKTKIDSSIIDDSGASVNKTSKFISQDNTRLEDDYGASINKTSKFISQDNVHLADNSGASNNNTSKFISQDNIRLEDDDELMDNS